jgi:hypothetical protein
MIAFRGSKDVQRMNVLPGGQRLKSFDTVNNQLASNWLMNSNVTGFLTLFSKSGSGL